MKTCYWQWVYAKWPSGIAGNKISSEEQETWALALEAEGWEQQNENNVWKELGSKKSI